jgi:hypothetical protein
MVGGVMGTRVRSVKRQLAAPAFVAGLVVLTSTREAAAGGEPNWGSVANAFVMTLLPHDVGALLLPGNLYPSLGWSLQVPLHTGATLRHRLVGGFDWTPGSYEHRVRWRAGYRVGTRHLFVGVGYTRDRTASTWSPELGTRLFHESSSNEGLVRAAHFIVRTDIARNFEDLRAVTWLIGWDML